MSKNNHTDRSLAAERQERIRGILRDRRVARVEELCSQLGVSAATIRRDLAELEERGALQRVHGGALSIESRLDEPLFDDKTSIAVREKRAIADRALRLIQNGETIYLDGGSTVLELARMLQERTDLTVVTNSLRAAVELSGRGPRLILGGGELRRRSQTVIGSLSRLILSQLHLDRAFMGTIGLTADEGLTTTDPNEAYTKELVMKRARQVVVLADKSKIGKVSFAHAGALDDVDVLITEEGVEESLSRALQKANVELVEV